MFLAAFDADAIYQLVILLILGGGSLVKKFIEARQGGQDEPSESSPYKFKSKRDEGPLRRSSGARKRSAARPLDPWVAPVEKESGVSVPEEAAPRELVLEPALVEEPVDASAATEEVSIEGPSLEGVSLEGASYDEGTVSKEEWKPEERIRVSVFEDIEQSVSQDIAEHVAADMAGGVRGEATATKAPVNKVARAHRGWRDAVIAAEILAPPVSLRDCRGPATPAGS